MARNFLESSRTGLVHITSQILKFFVYAKTEKVAIENFSLKKSDVLGEAVGKKICRKKA